MENPDGNSGFSQVGGDIAPGTEVFDHQVPLYARVNAEYMLESCVNDDNKDCSPSSTVSVSGTLVDSIGYFKASNADEGDRFGWGGRPSTPRGTPLAVGAPVERSEVGGHLPWQQP